MGALRTLASVHKSGLFGLQYYCPIVLLFIKVVSCYFVLCSLTVPV